MLFLILSQKKGRETPDLNSIKANELFKGA